MIRKLLLWLYPAAWRKEYGEEFADVLSSRPLTPLAIANVFFSALWQRLRHPLPWLLSGLFQFLLFVTWMVVLLAGHLSIQAGVRLMIPAAILVQIGTGVWIAARRNGTFLSGLAGTIGAALVAYMPLVLVTLLAPVPADFPDRTLVVHMKFETALRIFTSTTGWAALLGCGGAFVGSMIKRFRGHFA